MTTTLGLLTAVPILHSGLGCGLGQQFGMTYAGGQNAGGPQGTTNTPCSGLIEEHVVFGGEKKLRDLIQSTIELMHGELFVVISGCVPALIGDDVDSIVKDFRQKVPIVHVKGAGFTGTSYDGYDALFEGFAEQLLEPRPVQRKLVNIFGVVPFQHLFWKGTLATLKTLLASVGVEANVILNEFDSLENVRRIPAAELNIVLSPWNGRRIAATLEKKFGTPSLLLPTAPVGPKQTTKFLLEVGKRLNLPEKAIKAVVEKEERAAYRTLEYLGDAVVIANPQSWTGIVADSTTAIGVTQYLTNEMVNLPELVIITDNPPEEARPLIIRELTEGLEIASKPEIIFEQDAHLIRERLKKTHIRALFASSLEKVFAAEELGIVHLSVAFPSFDRLIADRTYTGYRGGLALLEDYLGKMVGPL